MQITNGIVQGVLRVLNKLIAKDIEATNVKATTFTGSLTGNASSATKVGSTTVGGTTTPIYLNGGAPTAIGYTISTSVPSNAKFTDTWRGIQNNLTSTSTTDSLSAAQGKKLKELVDDKLPYIELTDEDLNTLNTAGFYTALAKNTCTHKPDDVSGFGLIISRNAVAPYCTQIVFSSGKSYRRHYTNKVWTDWQEEQLTDTTYDIATTSSDGLMSSNDKSKVDNLNFAYGTCTTAASTAAKVVTLSDNVKWELKTGSKISVLFSSTNTASNPTLNVNGTGAKTIAYNAKVITTSSLSYAGYANRLIEYVYDGTKYVWCGWGVDNNTWTAFKGATDSTKGTAGYVPAPTAGDSNRFLRSDGSWTSPVNFLSMKTITITLGKNSWSNNKISISSSGVTASNDVIVSPSANSFNAYSISSVRCVAQGANSLSFECDSKPDEDIIVNVMILGQEEDK